jgi:tripartite-type tricarboxylate transporter receptor subunit TctC
VRKIAQTARALAALVLAAVLYPPDAFAQGAAPNYPNRPVKIIVGFTPGGATDIVARLVAQKLQEAWGQPFVVENRPGAGSNIGAEVVVKSPADGYTLLLGTIANATNMTAYKNLNYDTLRDLAPVTQTMSAPSVLVVHPGVPAKSLRELIGYAKAHPGKLSFASSGAGGSPHLAGEMLKLRTGIDIVHIPYKGAAPALADVLSGEVPMGFKTALSAIPHMQSGKLRAIAVAANKRLAMLPDVPTMAEAGLPDFEVSSWNGVFAPIKTPPDIVAKLHKEIVRILALPDVRERFAAQAAEPVGNTPEAFRAYVQAEIAKWGKVIRESGARID